MSGHSRQRLSLVQPHRILTRVFVCLLTIHVVQTTTGQNIKSKQSVRVQILFSHLLAAFYINLRKMLLKFQHMKRFPSYLFSHVIESEFSSKLI